VTDPKQPLRKVTMEPMDKVEGAMDREQSLLQVMNLLQLGLPRTIVMLGHNEGASSSSV